MSSSWVNKKLSTISTDLDTIDSKTNKIPQIVNKKLSKKKSARKVVFSEDIEIIEIESYKRFNKICEIKIESYEKYTKCSFCDCNIF